MPQNTAAGSLGAVNFPLRVMPRLKLSIIIPTLNEAVCIRKTLNVLQQYRGKIFEIIVVDGSSSDRTVELARPLADVVLYADRGRASQMNAGAIRARGNYLLFLHADTTLAENAFFALERCISEGRDWGRFEVKLSGKNPLLRIIEYLINLRSRLTGIATGDQAIFVRRNLFNSIGGFADLALMEDIVLSKRLRAITAPTCLRENVISSSRRWEGRGILRTIMLMWILRLKFFFGVNPNELAKKYN